MSWKTTRRVAWPILFETATLLGFIFLGWLGLQVDNLLGFRSISTGPYGYLGIGFILGGVSLRFWASSTVFSTGKGTPLYARPPMALVTTGPYRLIRNPLYLGGFLIFLGILIEIPSLFVEILGIVGLPITAIGIMREERGLQRKFGEEYRRYKQKVPGWIPRINRNGST